MFSFFRICWLKAKSSVTVLARTRCKSAILRAAKAILTPIEKIEKIVESGRIAALDCRTASGRLSELRMVLEFFLGGDVLWWVWHVRVDTRSLSHLE